MTTPRVADVVIDHAHIVVVPILLGRGVRLWDGLEGLEARYAIESVVSPSGQSRMARKCCSNCEVVTPSIE